MTDKARIRLAAAVTALFLAGISVAGLAARDEQPQATATAADSAATTPTPTATIDDSASGERQGGDHDEADDDRYEEVEDDE